MSWMTAEQMVLEAAKGPDLAAALRLVEEAEAAGQPKFMPRSCRELARVVTCRSYAPAVLELSHLIVAAAACGRRPGAYEDFFWASGPARASRLRDFLWQRLDGGRDGLVLTDQGVEIGYGDGSFAVTYARMPFLSALMEFLLTALGYGPLDELWGEMLDRGPAKARVSATANRISRLLYAYLSEQLPSAQSARKFAGLIAFMKAACGRDFALEDLDDEVVLAFWVAEAGGSADFRTYASVFQAFVRLRQALAAAADHQALGRPASIGYDRQAGEVDPGDIERLAEAVDETCHPLEALAAASDGAVKFLTKTECGDLQVLADCGSTAVELPLSALRAEVFGAGQARITQGLRRKLPAAERRQLIDDCAAETYEERRARLDRLARQVDKLIWASIFALLQAQRSEALLLMVELRPGLDVTHLAGALQASGGGVVALKGPAFGERLIALLLAPETAGPEVAALVARAKSAFQAVSRKGFDGGNIDDETLGDSFLDGARALAGLRGELARFRRALSRTRLPAGDWAGQFAADKAVFRSQFHVLYGESS